MVENASPGNNPGNKIKIEDIIAIISVIGILFGSLGSALNIPQLVKNILGTILIISAIVLILYVIYRIVPENTKERFILIGRAIKGESLPDFYHNPAEGTLSYGRHRIRNIAARIKTVNLLIDNLSKGESLENCGHLVGRVLDLILEMNLI